jgi:hypothetical protein
MIKKSVHNNPDKRPQLLNKGFILEIEDFKKVTSSEDDRINKLNSKVNSMMKSQDTQSNS